MPYTYTDLAHDFWPYAFLALGVILLLQPSESSKFRTVAYTILGWLVVLVSIPHLIGNLGPFLFLGLASLCFALMKRTSQPVSGIYVIGMLVFAAIGIVMVPGSPEFRAALSALLIY